MDNKIFNKLKEKLLEDTKKEKKPKKKTEKQIFQIFDKPKKYKNINKSSTY